MRTAGAVLIFVAVSVCAAVVLAFPCGGLSRGVAWAAFAAGLAAAVPAWRGIRDDPPRPTAWDVLLLIVFALASLRAFLWLIYAVGDEWRVLSPNNLGDISLHLQMIRYLAGGVDFWPASPILAGAPLTYPLGADLFNSLLLCAGVPVEKGLIWAGLGGAALTGWALWRWGGGFAVAALLFNGGLAGFLVFQTGHVADFQAELAWKNFFLSMFVTQRGLLYALPCGLFLLGAWRGEFFRGRVCVPRWAGFVLYATLPFFSVHAFVFLSLVLACAFCVRPSARLPLLRFVGAAFLPASATVYFVSGKFSASSGLRWLPGWMQGSEWAMFWIWNFGAALPLLLLLAWRIGRGRKPEALCFAGTGLIVFLVCCFVSFAPWEWDNTKLFLWAWLACAPFLWEMIAGWPSAVRAATCVALFFSGAASLVGGLDGRHGYKLINRSVLTNAAAALRQVPAGDRIVIEPEFNNPVILLGRPVFCGYEGHLWSHGLNYRRQWDSLQLVLKKSPGWQNALGTIEAEWIFLQGPPPRVVPLGSPHGRGAIPR
ncbi:MAG: hypothetical protein WCS31_08345 [Verrucomicrobiae bacterium]